MQTMEEIRSGLSGGERVIINMICAGSGTAEVSDDDMTTSIVRRLAALGLVEACGELIEGAPRISIRWNYKLGGPGGRRKVWPIEFARDELMVPIPLQGGKLTAAPYNFPTIRGDTWLQLTAGMFAHRGIWLEWKAVQSGRRVTDMILHVEAEVDEMNGYRRLKALTYGEPTSKEVKRQRAFAKHIRGRIRAAIEGAAFTAELEAETAQDAEKANES